MNKRDKIFEDLIQTIERTAVNNTVTISNVDFWAKSWREEQKQYLFYNGFSSESENGQSVPSIAAVAKL